MANPTPTPDHDANLFARAGRHLAAERDEKARVVLAALTGGGQPEVTELRLKAGLPIDKALRSRGLLPRECHRVHITDQWRCCYCGRFLINTRVLECIALLAGNDVCPYVNDHYRGPQETTDPATWITHPAIRRHAVQVEHVRPRSREQEQTVRRTCVPSA